MPYQRIKDFIYQLIRLLKQLYFHSNKSKELFIRLNLFKKNPNLIIKSLYHEKTICLYGTICIFRSASIGSNRH